MLLSKSLPNKYEILRIIEVRNLESTLHGAQILFDVFVFNFCKLESSIMKWMYCEIHVLT